MLTLEATALLCGAPEAEAQQLMESGRCYRFDQDYFQWTGVDYLTPSPVTSQTTVIGDSLVVDVESLSWTWYKVLSDSSLARWRTVHRDSSAVVRLSPDPSDGHPRLTPRALKLVAPAMPGGPSTERVRELSYWRPAQSDTLELAWLNGFSGTIFRLAARGDTLRGRVTFRTDVVGREPRVADSWAIRIACPDSASAPFDINFEVQQ